MLMPSGAIPLRIAVLVIAGLTGAGTTADAEGMTELQYMKQALDSEMRDAEQSGNEAALVMGKQNYHFDVVVCVRGMIESAIASDGLKRPNYPEVKISYAESAAAAGGHNTVSILFNRQDGRELWRLLEGTIEESDGRVEAIGYLQGSSMEEQADGTLKSAPIEGASRVAFGAAIICD